MKGNNKERVPSKSSNSSLSRFTIESKPKLRSSNRLKREHVKIEYDNNSETSSSKIKEEPSNEFIEETITKSSQKKLKKVEVDNKEEIKLLSSTEIKKETETEDTNENIKAEPHEEKIDVKNIKIKKKLKLGEKPCNWQKILENLREMRKNSDAPVDSMGCHKCMDESAEPKVLELLMIESF